MDENLRRSGHIYVCGTRRFEALQDEGADRMIGAEHYAAERDFCFVVLDAVHEVADSGVVAADEA